MAEYEVVIRLGGGEPRRRRRRAATAIFFRFNTGNRVICTFDRKFLKQGDHPILAVS